MKPYQYIFLWLLPVLFALPACKDPEKQEGNLTIELSPYVGSQPFSYSSTYTDGNREFNFSKLKFYVSHFKLVKEDNSEVEVKDVAYLDYSNNSWKSFSVQADAGTYKGIKFSVGLDPVQNLTDPSSLPASNPLGPQPDMHWDWLKYRFILLEGIADTLGNGFGGGNTLLAYHIGSDSCYRQVSLSNASFTVGNIGAGQLMLKLDLLKVFQGSGAIDMYTEPGTQSENSDLPTAIKFANRFSESFSY